MRVVSWILRVVIFAAALLFAAANIKTNVELNLGVEQFTAPLVLFLLIFFVAGVVTGLLSVVPTVFRHRREIGRLKREVKANAKAVAATMPPTPDAPTTIGDAPALPRSGL